MRKNHTDITIILDASGSMQEMEGDVIQQINNLIKKNRDVDGTATVSVYQFNTDISPIFENRDVREAEVLKGSYSPFGSTALYRSVCRVFDSLGEKYRKMTEGDKPEKVCVVIITDGEENASGPSYPLSMLESKIKDQRETWKWNIAFVGTNEAGLKEVQNFAQSGGIMNIIDTGKLKRYGNDSKSMLFAAMEHTSYGIVGCRSMASGLSMNAYADAAEAMDKAKQAVPFIKDEVKSAKMTFKEKCSKTVKTTV